MSHGEDKVEYVSEDIIQAIFNEGQYYLRMLRGELTSRVRSDRVPKRQKEGHPPGTRSQYVVYYNQDGSPVAGVHQYLLPDGTLGGSGRPDPKVIFLPDRTIKLKPE